MACVLRPARDTDGLAAALGRATVVLLAVPDAAIRATASAVAGALPGGAAPAVVHLSGALGLDELAPAAARGCAVGSLHPFQPFASVRPPEAFAGSTVAIEAGDAAVLARLRALAAAIGARPRHVRDDQRVLYHAAAVVASAHVVALASQARRLLVELGFDDEEALAALLPLLRGAAVNLEQRGLPDALSGPLRRGDADTVARHVAELARLDAPDLLDAYLALSREGVRLAAGTGLDAEGVARLRGVLDGADARS